MSVLDAVNGLDAVNALDVDAVAALPIDDALLVWNELTEAKRVLDGVLSLLPGALAPSWGEKQTEVPGVGVFVLRAKKDRTQWDKDALLRDVLDSRMVNETTGEIESPLEKVLAVWNLPAPRVTALRARGLDPDDYCHTEFGGWQIQKL